MAEYTFIPVGKGLLAVRELGVRNGEQTWIHLSFFYVLQRFLSASGGGLGSGATGVEGSLQL